MVCNAVVTHLSATNLAKHGGIVCVVFNAVLHQAALFILFAVVVVRSTPAFPFGDALLMVTSAVCGGSKVMKPVVL